MSSVTMVATNLVHAATRFAFDADGIKARAQDTLVSPLHQQFRSVIRRVRRSAETGNLSAQLSNVCRGHYYGHVMPCYKVCMLSPSENRFLLGSRKQKPFYRVEKDVAKCRLQGMSPPHHKTVGLYPCIVRPAQGSVQGTNCMWFRSFVLALLPVPRYPS